MPVEELAALAQDVFGEDRVTSVERLDDAIDRRIELAEAGVADASLGGAGVLVDRLGRHGRRRGAAAARLQGGRRPRRRGVLVTGSRCVMAGDAGRLLRG